MKAVTARLTRGLNIGSYVEVCDNSGARIAKIVSVVRAHTRKGRQTPARVGDWVKVSIRKGDPKMKGQVFDAVVVRQKKPWRRLTGERVCFTDNAVVLLKDEKGNPKGTQIKGPIAREVQERWKEVSKLASVIY
ncbi:MAG: uL14 family ribosomal protein [Candidatus Pacearchaeota archaeon]